jgi:peptidoglycan lytic transglycosylase
MLHAPARIWFLIALSAVLASCGTTGPMRPPATISQGAPGPTQPELIPNPVYKVGMPYQVAGVWYYPQEQTSYNETGIASWYGSQYHGRLTADGELFDRAAITGAHPTLPMPVNVRVTNLENGKSIVVRVNDRGPFVNGRIIDLSERAADLLGYRTKGTARVRVTYLGRASLRGLGPATAAEETPLEVAQAVPAAPTRTVVAASLPQIPGIAVAAPRPVAALPRPVAQPVSMVQAAIPDGIVTELPVPDSTAIFVQVGAFTSAANAGSVAVKLYGLGARVFPGVKDGQPIYRVRIGPFQDVDSADAVLGQVQGLGHTDVQIVVEAQSS